ncbi:MAG: hypothetical protein U9O94_05380, partial [Nanoarchaeota archaeon]|nr:hypothetical protein [Nanoarchaeota archaeon]
GGTYKYTSSTSGKREPNGNNYFTYIACESGYAMGSAQLAGDSCKEDLDCGTSSCVVSEPYCELEPLSQITGNVVFSAPDITGYAVGDLCQDSDDPNDNWKKDYHLGINYPTYGVISGIQHLSSRGIVFRDYCNQNGLLIEFFCTGPTTVASVKYNCSNGCENGACKGEVAIECSSNSDCGASYVSGSPICSGNSVRQIYYNYTCRNPGTSSASCSRGYTYAYQSCAYGCENGACKSAPVKIECSSNSDCGASYVSGSPICSGNSVRQIYYNYTCRNPGTSSA